MAKNAVITIELVPEAEDVDIRRLRKEILKSLRCDWMSEALNVNIETTARARSAKQP